MANLHNAMRAHVPVVNMVGDHTPYHLKYDAPLTSDVGAHARIVSDWVRVSESADDLALAGAEAVQASLRGAGKVTTFIAPANHAWDDASRPVAPLAPAGLETIDPSAIGTAADLLGNGRKTVLFLGGRALREESLHAAGRIAAATGVRLICEVFPTRLQRGAGRVEVERLPYFAEAATAFLEGTEQMILVGTKAPVSFFAYPGKPGWLAPENCEIRTLATVDQDALAALTGGAIGIGLPLALGSSIACPERKVIALQADGSAMYTLQALWSIAREQADVTVVIMNNRSYAILNIELARVGAGQPNAKTLSMLDLSNPDLDFVALAQGMGVSATRATTAEEFDAQFTQAMSEPGPRLIEAMVVQQMP